MHPKPPPRDPLTAPTKAMREAARRVKLPRGATPFIKKSYRDAAMLRVYWETKQ